MAAHPSGPAGSGRGRSTRQGSSAARPRSRWTRRCWSRPHTGRCRARPGRTSTAAPAAGATMRHNREAFERWRIVPRMLHGTTTRDLTTTVLGTELPVAAAAGPGRRGCADQAGQRRAHRQRRGGGRGRRTSSPRRAAARWRTPRAAMGDTPFWYQLYWSTDEPLVDSMIQPGRGVRCPGAGRHAGHHDARLAAPGPEPRVACRSRRARASRSTPPTRASARSSASASPRPPGRPRRSR